LSDGLLLIRESLWIFKLDVEKLERSWWAVTVLINLSIWIRVISRSLWNLLWSVLLIFWLRPIPFSLRMAIIM